MADYILVDGELYHFGIKGQKWGVRRFQKKDGSLTPAGKERYYDDKDDAPTESQKPAKQSRYDKLYQQYKTLGYSDADAAKTAKGRVTAERALAVVGVATVAAVAAYGAYRYYDINVDRYISSKQGLQTVHTGDISDRIKPGNPFYASYTKRDNTIYASKVFSHFTDQSNVTRMYTDEGIKVASEKTGRKIFNELLDTNPEVQAYSKRLGALGKGRKGYERFNYSLVLRNDSETAKRMRLDDLDHDKIHKIFYDELKKRGYGAVIDVNDSRKEGFTFNPVIVFDDQVKHVVGTTKASSSQLSGVEFAKGMAWAKTRRKTLNPTSSPALLAAGYAYLTAVGAVRESNRTEANKTKFVEEYLKGHPNTELTREQIDKMYEKHLTSS